MKDWVSIDDWNNLGGKRDRGVLTCLCAYIDNIKGKILNITLRYVHVGKKSLQLRNQDEGTKFTNQSKIFSNNDKAIEQNSQHSSTAKKWTFFFLCVKLERRIFIIILGCCWKSNLPSNSWDKKIGNKFDFGKFDKSSKKLQKSVWKVQKIVKRQAQRKFVIKREKRDFFWHETSKKFDVWVEGKFFIATQQSSRIFFLFFLLKENSWNQIFEIWNVFYYWLEKRNYYSNWSEGGLGIWKLNCLKI